MIVYDLSLIRHQSPKNTNSMTKFINAQDVD